MRFLYVILLVLVQAQSSFGSILYDNTILTNAVTSIGSPPEHIVFDDVLVPSARNPADLPLALTKITVLISAPPGASGSISIWNFPVQPNGTPTLPPTLIDSANITFTTPFHQVTFGDGSTTLFTVTPNFTADPGFGLFFIGLKGSLAISGAAWAWADGPDINRATAYNYDVASNTIFLNTSPPGFPPHVSYSLRIEGQPVPEPPAWGLLTLGLLILLGLARLAPAGTGSARTRDAIRY